MVLLFDSFVELVLLHELRTRLNVGGRRFIGQVEEIDVSLHEAFSKEFDSNRLFGHFLLELEVSFVLKLLPTSSHVSSCRGFLGSVLLCILVENGRFCGGNKLILLFGFGFLSDLPDTRVRVEYGLQFHAFVPHCLNLSIKFNIYLLYSQKI